MQYQIFQYPLPASDSLDDLNRFLASHRVAVVTHHVVPNPGGGMLVFLVEYVDGTIKSNAGRAPKVDYRELLNESDFALFSRLRDERKTIAEAEGVPVYAIFTNAQLAEMITRPVRTAADLRQVEGIGQAKADKYAARLLPLLTEREVAPMQADATT